MLQDPEKRARASFDHSTPEMDQAERSRRPGPAFLSGNSSRRFGTHFHPLPAFQSRLIIGVACAGGKSHRLSGTKSSSIIAVRLYLAGSDTKTSEPRALVMGGDLYDVLRTWEDTTRVTHPDCPWVATTGDDDSNPSEPPGRKLGRIREVDQAKRQDGGPAWVRRSAPSRLSPNRRELPE